MSRQEHRLKESISMSNHKLIEAVTKSQLRTDLPTFRTGDTLRVHVRIVEGSRERIQVFEGVVIKRRGGGISETFTVRKISSGVGVERTFPLHTPKIEKSNLNVVVKYVVLNYTTYVVYVVKLLESKKFVNQQTEYNNKTEIRYNVCLTNKASNLLLSS